MFRRQYLKLLGIGTGSALVDQAESPENETATETAQERAKRRLRRPVSLKSGSGSAS